MNTLLLGSQGMADPLVLERVGMTLLHFVWQGLVIAAGLAVLRRVLTRPASQYAVSCAALGIMVLCPAITYVSLSTERVWPAGNASTEEVRWSEATKWGHWTGDGFRQRFPDTRSQQDGWR